MKPAHILKLAIALILCCSGAAIADEGKDESGKGRPPARKYRHEKEGGSYFHRHGYGRLDIPKGHYPPPGECRIWYPDLPPGQQPPPGGCAQLRREVPPGAWLIQHPEDDPDHVLVNVYDARRPGIVMVVGEFEIGSGVFVRIVGSR